MTTFTTKILATVAAMALTFGGLQAGDKKGGKPSSHSGPSKPTSFEKSDHKKYDKDDFKHDKYEFKHDKYDFHFKWYPPCYPSFCWFPQTCYAWWPYCPPSYPYGMKPIDPGMGNGYPPMKSYK